MHFTLLVWFHCKSSLLARSRIAEAHSHTRCLFSHENLGMPNNFAGSDELPSSRPTGHRKFLYGAWCTTEEHYARLHRFHIPAHPRLPMGWETSSKFGWQYIAKHHIVVKRAKLRVVDVHQLDDLLGICT